MTREEARATGTKRYQGPPCYVGHEGVRYTSSGMCVPCADKRRREVYTKPANEKAKVST